MRTILLDCDDVLLDWLESFRVYMEDQLGRKLHPDGPKSWDMSGWLGLSKEECVEYIVAHNADPTWFGKLRPTQGAVEAVRALAETATLHVVTSCASDDVTWHLRHQNLTEHFGPMFRSLTCLDLGQSKRDVLAQYKGNVVWIEDNLKNAMLGVDLGFRVYMRRTSHNTIMEPDAHKSITWFTNWDELNPERI